MLITLTGTVTAALKAFVKDKVDPVHIGIHGCHHYGSCHHSG